MATMILTNKSERMYTTSKGVFFPGTSKEFNEAEAIQLLGYSDIKRADKALGGEFQKTVEKKDEEIAELHEQIEQLNKKLKDATAKTNKAK